MSDPPPVATPRRAGPDRSLLVHGALLALALVAVVGLTSRHGVFSADEGAARAQSRHLADTGRWDLPNPFPQVDPTGTAFAYQPSRRGAHGLAPFPRHPLYTELLAFARRLGGAGLEAGWSLLGGVVAALGAAAIARRLRPALAVPALWVTGLASPLLFASALTMAHTLVTAAAALAVLGALRFLDGRRSGLVWVALAGALATGWRSEAPLFSLALAVGAVAAVTPQGHGPSRAALRRAVPVAAAAVGGAVAGAVVDRVAATLLLDGPGTTTLVQHFGSGGLVADRVDAFTKTWVQPADNVAGWTVVPLLFLAAAAALGLLLRRRGAEAAMVWVVAGLLALVGAGWVLRDGESTVPGLLCAFPFLAVGALSWRRDLWARAEVRLLAVTAAVFWLGVLATEYPVGGGAEWGARYSTPALPLVVPLLLEALWRSRARLDAASRRAATAALAVVLLVPSVVAVRVLWFSHHATARLVGELDARAQRTPAGDGGAPVVVSDVALLGRYAWEVVPHGRWLMPTDGSLPAVAGRLRRAGVRRFVYVRPLPLPAADVIPGYRVGDCVRLHPETSGFVSCVARGAPSGP